MIDLSVLQKFLNFITWKKIAQLFLVFLILGIALMVFENRNIVYRYLGSEKLNKWSLGSENFKFSKKSSTLVDSIVKKYDNIIGIQITLVDFKKNIRIVVYTSVKDPGLSRIYSHYLDSSVNDMPLFNTDNSHNIRMSQLINGEFICNPFNETTGYRMHPDANDYIKYVCANGIPPYYGQFIGIITIFLKNVPISTEVDQLRLITRETSKSIFEEESN